MRFAVSVLIVLFGSASYVIGAIQVLRGSYKPNVFSRIVWLLLAANSYAAIAISRSSRPTNLLALLFLTGNALICLLSFWKGNYSFGRLERTCLALLALSALVWIVFRAPLVNLCLGLCAHFIGALPTIKKAWQDGSSESAAFWSLFCVASLLTILTGTVASVESILFPLYFALFDGGMTVLALRRHH